MGASLLEWGGGIDFLKNIINALNYDDEAYDLHLLVPYSGKSIESIIKKYIKTCLGKPCFKGIPKKSIRDITEAFPNMHVIYFDNTSRGLIRAVQKSGIELLFPCCYALPKHFPIPWIGHIPDFQHRRLPEYFSDDEKYFRDQTDIKLLSAGVNMMMISKDAVNDAQEFFPDHPFTSYIIPFAPVPRKEWLYRIKEEILSEYSFPNAMRFFLISNQFWVHKNHLCAFKALKQLHNIPEYNDIHIICTGAKTDYRNQSYMEEINQYIEEAGLEKYIHFLGYIPKIDQISLMKKSIAVIQPTLFEGSPGGLEIYDAVSIGQQSIVSDIPVNRELEEDSVLFFESGSCESLCKEMIEAIKRNWTYQSSEELEDRGNKMQKKNFDFLLGLIEDTLQGSR